MKFFTRNLIASGAIALLAVGGLTTGATGSPANRSDVALQRLTQVMPLSKAMQAVGQAAIISANSHLDPNEVLEAAKDSSAWVDLNGMLYYVEPEHIEIETDDVFVSTNSIATSDAFELNSRPSAKRVLFLDFDGHLVSGTGWNSSYNGGADFYATPYDRNGNTATWSDSELREIISIWQRVAEDYAPFDVNITTKDPGEAAIVRTSSSDEFYGTRQLVTNGTNPVRSSCGCGGIAYVGVFNRTTSHASTNIAFTFNSGAKNAAEAISHEAGHNLGLSHDGSSTSGYYGGHNGWAPIMGVGYYEPLSQWSKGEYSGATQPQDDLQRINDYGAIFATDDHGNTSGLATPIAAGTVDLRGLIGRPSDVDVFKFTSGAGRISLAASPATVSPNLDIRLVLTDANGNILVDVNPASAKTATDAISGLNAALTYDVTETGTYYLTIDGVGRGDLITGYSDYGSLGYYRITGSVPGDVGVPAPTITGLSPASGPVGTLVSLSGTNLTGATSVQFGTTEVAFTVVSETEITFAVPTGAVSSSITVTTQGGSATSNLFTVTVPGPSVSSVSPVSGPVGTLVTVSGANLPTSLSGTTVTLGGVAVDNLSLNSASQLTFRVPNVADSLGKQIVVTATTGTATTASTFTIGPRIVSFVNTVTNTTTAAVGNLIRVTGDHFIGTTSVRLGTLAVANLNVVSDTEITFTVPTSAKSGRISVTANGVTFTSSSNLTIGKTTGGGRK